MRPTSRKGLFRNETLEDIERDEEDDEEEKEGDSMGNLLRRHSSSSANVIGTGSFYHIWILPSLLEI